MTATQTKIHPRDKRIRDVEEMAKKAFAEHRVEPLWVGVPFGPGMIEAQAWLCSQPDRSEYHFTIYSVPGRLIVCGDLGTLVVERTRNMLAWASTAIRDVNYFAEKVPSEISTEEFDPEMVRAWVAQIDQEVIEDEHSESFVKKWIRDGTRAEILSAIDDGEERVTEVYHECGLYDGDWPEWNNWTYRFLWQREAIKWFLNWHAA